MAMTATEKLRQLHGDKMLTVEEMESVAGGTTSEMADDTCFLNVLLRGHAEQPERYGEYRTGKEFDTVRMSLSKAWGAVGITMDCNEGRENSYYDQAGNQISRDEAYQHAMKVVGRQLKKSDWYWEK
jgi:hypothetical protein